MFVLQTLGNSKAQIGFIRGYIKTSFGSKAPKSMLGPNPIKPWNEQV